MSRSIPRYKTINDYLSHTKSGYQTNLPEFYILKLEDLSEETVIHMPPCQRDFYQINFITGAGEGSYRFNTHSKQQSANSVYLISPMHVYSWVRDAELQGYLLYFQKRLLSIVQGSLVQTLLHSFDPINQNELPLSSKEMRRMVNLCELAYDVYHSDRPNRLQTLGATVLAALTYLGGLFTARLSTEVAMDRNQAKFIAFRNLVNSLFLKHREVSNYADLLHISPNYLNVICKSQSGKTASSIIQDRILEEGLSLLLHTEKDVAEISYHLGFQEPTHFSRFVKSKIGMTPVEYRRSSS